MRSQIPNIDQASGSIEQKKSVFDRLGCQVETGRSMKRRPSPGQHGEWMPPPQVHDIEFARYSREPHPQNEIEWRYQNERRHIPPFPGERHPLQLAPPPPPQSHYDMDMGGRQNPYYPHPQHMYHNGPSGPPPPIGMLNMPMNMHQQRSSPKYDRHGNVIMNFKDRPGPVRLAHMDQYHGMSPPRAFMPGPMIGIPPGNQHDLMPRSNAMYPPQRWHGTTEEEFSAHPNTRMIPEDRFSPASARRQQQHHHHHHQQPHMLNNPTAPLGQVGEFPRYTKWRERRDVITTLDRETAQSSSRTDSLKSSLQQPESKITVKSESVGLDYAKGTSPVIKNPTVPTSRDVPTIDRKLSGASEKDSSTRDSMKSKHSVKTEPQEISDGEIVDDEDSSDDSEVVKTSSGRSDFSNKQDFSGQSKNLHMPYGRTRETHQCFEPGKKRRLHERDEYSMDYETISDEDLDIFMGDKKISDLTSADAKLGTRLDDEEGKSLSEIELLNALGLDWANLVEMAKQSKTSGKDPHAPGLSLPRFSMQNYLPTLGIAPDLVGSEIYDLVLRVSRGT